MTHLQTVSQSVSQLHSFNNEQVNLIKSTIAVGATDDELKLFLHHASRAGLDPLAKQIYFQKRQGKMVIITGIDGLRLIAERTGKYAGNDDPSFDDEQKPTKASVTIWKIMGGVRCPFTASARWEQYYPGEAQGFMWKKMPHLMLGKCAEALALRKAFPAELSGIYGEEEMYQADKDPSDNKQHAKSAQERLSAVSQPNPDVVDAESVEPEPTGEAPNASYVIKFGKMKGKTLVDVELDRHISMVKWFTEQEAMTNKPTSGVGKEYMDMVVPYIRFFRPDADLPF